MHKRFIPSNDILEASLPTAVVSLIRFARLILPYTVYAFIALTILLPKLPVPGGGEVQGTYVKIRYDDFIVLSVVVVWFLGGFWACKKFFTNILNQTIFFYWFIGLVSLIIALLITRVIVPPNSVYHSLGVIHWIRRIEYMVMFFVGFAATPNIKTGVRYVILLFASTFAVVIYGAGQVYAKWCSFSTTNREFSKGYCTILTRGVQPNSTFSNHAELAIFLSYLVGVLIGVFFAVKKWFYRIALVVLFGGTLWLLTLTQARMPFVATLVTVLLLLWIYGKKLWLVGFIALALIFLMVFGQALATRYKSTITALEMHFFTPKQEQQINEYQLVWQVTTAGSGYLATTSAIPGQDNLPSEEQYQKLHPVPRYGEANPALETSLSTSIRFNEEWPAALIAFFRNPIFGSGYSALGIATDNDYLRQIGETGLFGLAALAAIFVVLFRLVNNYLRTQKTDLLSRGMVIGLTAAMGSFFVNAVFIDVFEASKIATLFWLFAGILVAIMKHSKNNDTPVSSP